MGSNSKNKKAKKSKAKPQAEFRVALYGLAAETPKGAAVRAVLKDLGIPTRTVTPEHLDDPVGAVAGLVGFRPALRPFADEAPKGEFMLLCNLPNAKLDELLAALREADAQVPHKAVVTKFNKQWPFVRLMEEVSQEHAGVE
ncbi:MAG: DUF3783 domain-containing protein [Coriobacteriia bacterium]|nr:DUF3783 domain-containing protein [Coriobacteriia bacterium]